MKETYYIIKFKCNDPKYTPYSRCDTLTPIGFGRKVILPHIQEMVEMLYENDDFNRGKLITYDEYIDKYWSRRYDLIPAQCANIEFEPSGYSAIVLVRGWIWDVGYIKSYENDKYKFSYEYYESYYNVLWALNTSITRTIGYRPIEYHRDLPRTITRDVHYSIELIDTIDDATKQAAVKYFKNCGYCFQTSKEIREMWKQTKLKRRELERKGKTNELEETQEAS